MENISNLWINISKCKNFILEDPILDWLDLYGNKKGYLKDSKISSKFENLLQEKNNIFRVQIIKKVENKLKIHTIKKNLSLRERVSRTIDNMYLGKDIICFPCLFNNNNNSYGNPAMIIRSDKINLVFDKEIIKKEKMNKPCLFSNNYHYLIIDIKHTKLKMDFDRNISNNKANKFLKSKLILYNYCLGSMQKYLPEISYTISKNYSYIDEQKKKVLDTDPLSNIGCVRLENNKMLINKAFSSIKWLHELNIDGSEWGVAPPNNSNLYPNMCNQDDFPWHQSKLDIANSIHEITMLWNCGPKIRRKAHLKGIYKWNKMDTIKMEMGEKKSNIINKIIDINCYSEDICISARKIKKKINKNIIKKGNLEFIVDFETINNFTECIADNEISLPYIFMVGCLTVFKNNKNEYETDFRNFTTKNLEENEEKRIINEWINYMNNFKEIYHSDNPKIYHWSNAEPVIYKQFLKKYNKNIDENLNFTDLLYVFKNEPIVVKNTFSYNLKEISKALYNFGMIETIWDDDNMNGKEAMIQAFIAYQNNKNSNQNKIIKKIKKYNYVDCKVIEEILQILRKME